MLRSLSAELDQHPAQAVGELHFDFKKLRVRQAVYRAYEGYARARELNLNLILEHNLNKYKLDGGGSDEERDKLVERRQEEGETLFTLQKSFSDLDPWVRRWSWHAVAAWPCSEVKSLSLLKMAEGWALDGHAFWQFAKGKPEALIAAARCLGRA